jgi:hypothetical protein
VSSSSFEKLNFLSTKLECLISDFGQGNQFGCMPNMNAALSIIVQQLDAFLSAASSAASSAALCQSGDDIMQIFHDKDDAFQLPFSQKVPDQSGQTALVDSHFADPVGEAPEWSLKSCSKFCPRLPELERQIAQECTYEMEQKWKSLKQQNWGLGGRDMRFFDTLPGEEQYVSSDFIRQCLKAFSVIRNDVLFIEPAYNDTILLSEPAEWSSYFKRKAQNCKFDYVGTIASLQGKVGLRKASGSRGVHWIVIIGDVKKKISWFYDPTDFHLPPDSYPREMSILDRFMTFCKRTPFKFTTRRCNFDTNCQDLNYDSVNCGLWCVMYFMNWCLGTLRTWKQLCDEKKGSGSVGLPSLAVTSFKRIQADIDRHNLLDISFQDVWRSPTIDATQSSFWTIIPVNILAHCNHRYGTLFYEIKLRDRKPTIPTGATPVSCPPQLPFFIRDGIHIIKIHRFLWGKVSSYELATALHEVAGTEYTCCQKGWFCETFGVVSKGACASYVYICLCRKELNIDVASGSFSQEQVSEQGKALYDSTCVAHGDWHPGNVMKNGLGIEFVDFDRSFIPLPNFSKQEIHDVINSYANAKDEQQRGEILTSQVKPLGLKCTRNRFIRFAEDCLAEPAMKNLFLCTIDDLKNIFAPKPCANPE